MLKTPSVMSSLRCPAGSSFRIVRAASTSRCGKTLMVARLRRQPSMMLAWFSSSDTTASCRLRIADTVPAFAVNPLWKTTAASVCLKAARRRSSSSCTASVPAIVRTDPAPTPNCRVASRAASHSRGCVVRPR